MLNICLLLHHFLLSGADRGEEGLVKTQSHAGHQAEIPDDQQCWRRQLLLRRHDVTHHHAQRQFISSISQIPLCRRSGGLRWVYRWRIQSEATAPQLSVPTEQPVHICSCRP